MDSTPPPYSHRHRSKSATKPAASSPKSPAVSLPLRELLLLSPSSPLRRSAKARLADRLDAPPDDFDPVGAPGPKRRCKSSRASQLGCASPRTTRRSRRRSEVDATREDADETVVAVKPRKRRQSVKKDRLSSLPSSSTVLLPSTPKMEDEDIQAGLDRMGQLMSDLVMWRDLAKSSLWFGLGSLFFFSSCFAHGLAFSVFSVISKLGFLFLGLSFFSNSMRQRNNGSVGDYRLKEDDILRVAKVILPYVNLAISKTRQLFSGDPCTTLKVAPLLLVGSEYGHLITIRRLCAIGFFLSFTVPKIFSCYNTQIRQKVEYLSLRGSEKWATCSHKKIVAASVLTAFWNLSTVKTRIFTAFMCVVLVRYWREHIAQELLAKEVTEGEENPQKPLLLVGPDCEQIK